MKLAVVQSYILLERQEDNLRMAAAGVDAAWRAGADVVFFPEMSFTGFSMQVEQLIPMGRDALTEMQRLAREHEIAIGFGCVTEGANGKGQNSYFLLDTTGNVQACYQKLHPFSYGSEDQFYEKGEKIVTATLGGISISPLICYDLRFPELFRLAAQQASLVVVPANWLSRRSAHWKVLLHARAIENQMYVLGVNCVGSQGAYQFLGQSVLYDPEGTCLLDCGETPGIYFAQLETPVEQFRENFPAIRDARWEWYAHAYADTFLK